MEVEHKADKAKSAPLSNHFPSARKSVTIGGLSIAEFQQRLGYEFVNQALLEEALIHPSCKRHDRGNSKTNQRLEFLGDAVLQLAVTEKLFALLPDADEGEMTKLRSRLVSRESMARVATEIDLGSALFLGAGEERNQGRTRESNLADAMEAVLGAVHLDAGWETARALVLRLLESVWPRTASNVSESTANAKGALQELLQREGAEAPTYLCQQESGEAHARTYEVAVFWQGRELGRGTGSSKRLAEVAAARVAWDSLGGKAPSI